MLLGQVHIKLCSFPFTKSCKNPSCTALSCVFVTIAHQFTTSFGGGHVDALPFFLLVKEGKSVEQLRGSFSVEKVPSQFI